jgi:DNA ligase-1
LLYKGQDLRSLPLMKRKEILHSVLSPHKLITPVLYLDGMFGSKLADETKKRNMEGVTFKRKNSTYKSGRHKEWMKLVHYKTAEVIIGGYRKEKFGWLLRHPETFEPLGIMELGTNSEDRKRFAQQSKPLITGEDSKYVYIEPSIRIRVKFPRYSRNGYLRTPSFQEFIS